MNDSYTIIVYISQRYYLYNRNSIIRSFLKRCKNTQLNPLRVFKARGIPLFYYSLLFRNLRYGNLPLMSLSNEPLSFVMFFKTYFFNSLYKKSFNSLNSKEIMFQVQKHILFSINHFDLTKWLYFNSRSVFSTIRGAMAFNRNLGPLIM
jgi:hypothetical protein